MTSWFSNQIQMTCRYVGAVVVVPQGAAALPAALGLAVAAVGTAWLVQATAPATVIPAAAVASQRKVLYMAPLHN
ncbi:MAG: hypothetical protein ACRDOD_10190, partial [Streptosporangiaceae bacterium]